MICDLATYRRITGDGVGGTVDGDVSAALVDAQELAERYCARFFELAQRTEVVRLYTTGRVYPKAFPIVSVAGNTSSVIDGSSVILGYGYQYAAGVNPFVSGFGADSVAYQPQVTLTYTGGYAPGEIPGEVVRAVALLAYNMLHPANVGALPVGATSVRLGDASVSGPSLQQFGSMDHGIYSTLRRYRRAMAEPF